MKKFVILILCISHAYIFADTTSLPNFGAELETQLSYGYNNGIMSYYSMMNDDGQSTVLINRASAETLILQSRDRGDSWNIIYADTVVGWPDSITHYPDEIFVSMSKTGENSYLVATESGKMAKTTDNCKTWEVFEQNLGPGDFNDMDVGYQLFMVDNMNGYMTDSKKVFVTSDGGHTWERISPGYDFVLIDAAYLNDDVLYLQIARKIDGESLKYILKYNADKTWESVPVEKSMEGFYFINEDVGFAYGGYRDYDTPMSYFPYIIKTTDGGRNWRVCLDSSASIHTRLYDMDFYDEQNGLAVGSTNGLLRTTDGGETWIEQAHYDEMKGYTTFLKVWFSKPNEAVLCNIHKEIVKYTEHGTSVSETGKDEIKVYPNPAENVININIPKNVLPEAGICCVNSAGKRCDIPFTRTKGIIKGNIGFLPKGIYFIVINDGSTIIKTSFIKI